MCVLCFKNVHGMSCLRAYCMIYGRAGKTPIPKVPVYDRHPRTLHHHHLAGLFASFVAPDWLRRPLEKKAPDPMHFLLATSSCSHYLCRALLAVLCMCFLPWQPSGVASMAAIWC